VLTIVRAEAPGFVWIIALTALYIGPVLSHGSALGPFDLLRQVGLTAVPGSHVHNATGSDEIQALIPWQSLDWQQVHTGHLPLWNPYSVLGMPLAFNMQSAPFSLSVALGYLFPLPLAHTATVIARLLLAGFGAYFFARVLGLSRTSASMAATTWELCGGFSVWLGSNTTDICAWYGWIFGAVVLVLRDRSRIGAFVALVAFFTLALYGGEPQSALLLGACVAAYVAITQLFALADRRGAVHRVARVAGALLIAAGLSMPLYLPAAELAPLSVRSVYPLASGLPAYDLTHLVFATYNGSPLYGATVIGPDNLYASMMYVGVIAIVLSLVALFARPRSPQITAFSAIAVSLMVILFSGPLVSFIQTIPHLQLMRVLLATSPLDFCFAMLASFGCEYLIKNQRHGRAPLTVATALVAAAVGFLGLKLAVGDDHLDASARAARAASFVWPGIEIAAVAAVLIVIWSARARTERVVTRLIACMLLGTQTAFLVAVGYPIWSTSDSYFPVNASVRGLRAEVGSSLVGLGWCPYLNSFSPLGILPNANAAYDIAEMSVYDPILPRAYYSSWGAAVGVKQSISSPGVFCPGITSVSLARTYGIGFVLEPAAAPAPRGMIRVARLADETLYRVPQSGRVTVSSPGRRSKVVPAREAAPDSWVFRLDAARGATVDLRITDVPGWNATVNGHALQLSRWRGVMMRAHLPEGRDTVVLRYWPTSLTIGLWIAGASALVLLAMLVGRYRSITMKRRGLPMRA
jgi:hypothetical protein